MPWITGLCGISRGTGRRRSPFFQQALHDAGIKFIHQGSTWGVVAYKPARSLLLCYRDTGAERSRLGGAHANGGSEGSSGRLGGRAADFGSSPRSLSSGQLVEVRAPLRVLPALLGLAVPPLLAVHVPAPMVLGAFCYILALHGPCNSLAGIQHARIGLASTGAAALS